ncbi:hypothetical protein HPP92_001547 [Vanilla planifolia]|uniref:Saposin B-type domain-containing protein n=1 Tax=Vanilla planifolia TaxID=51239 RepID=A0A835VLH8_VANPL|nr:hypothetical protein HPP92_001547 [Vanilla planifolia]
MKRIGLLRCILVLLFTLAKSEGSRKAEEQLSNRRLYEEIERISQEACHFLPPDLKDMCLETSETYAHAPLLLKELVDEETLCNQTGLCIMKLEKKIPMERTDQGSCAACRRSVKDLFYQLKQSKIRIRVMDALLEQCEEAGIREDQCKGTVYKYAPHVLDKLERLKASDICRVIDMCGEGVAI